MATYVTADTHFSHDAILNYSKRPFSSIEEHDAHLIGCINKKVGVHDELFVCGDFSFGGHLRWRQQIKCKNIWLIEGNHDKMNNEARAAFVKVELAKTIKRNNMHFFLSHYCHSRWANHSRTVHLYGHSHGHSENFMDLVMPNRMSADIGVDVAKRVLGDYEPFSIEEAYMFATRKRPWHFRLIGNIINKVV